MPAPSPDHLLDQADRLLASTGSGPPRQADLRRAISSAYYALFHAILAAAADDIVGRRQQADSRYALLYRSVDHRSLRQTCQQLLQKVVSPKYARYAPSAGFGDDLIALANAVVELQEKRILADYDPLYRVTATDVAIVLDTARKALAQFRAANRTQRRAFLSLIVFQPR